MATTQYIGARYVPRHMGEWDANTQYGALDVVLYTDGNSYTAKCVPPKGTVPTNDQYWALSAQFNQQLASVNNRIDVAYSNISAIENNLFKVVNVKAKGADNTGITPCSDLIQSLVESNAVLFFEDGTYLFDKPVDIQNNYVKIIGGGNTKFIKSGSAVGGKHSDRFAYTYNKNSFFNIACDAAYLVGAYFKDIIFSANNMDCAIDASFAALWTVETCRCSGSDNFIFAQGSWSTNCIRCRSQCKKANYKFDGGTSHYFERCNCDGGIGTTSGYELKNCEYSLLVNCSADTMGNFAYSFSNSVVTLVACASEIAGVPIAALDGTDLTIIGGEFFKVITGGSTAYNTMFITNSRVYSDGMIFGFYDGDEPYSKDKIIPLNINGSTEVVFNNFKWDGYTPASNVTLSNKAKAVINGIIYTNIFYEKANFVKSVKSSEKTVELLRFNVGQSGSVSAKVNVYGRMNYGGSGAEYLGIAICASANVVGFVGSNSNVNVAKDIAQLALYPNFAITFDLTARVDNNDIVIEGTFTTEQEMNEYTINVECEYAGGLNNGTNTVVVS